MPDTFKLAELIGSGRVVDLILGLMVLEAAALVIYRITSKHGLAALDIALTLIPGACLLLALRAALAGLPWTWVALALAAALPAHLFDLGRRLRASPRR